MTNVPPQNIPPQPVPPSSVAEVETNPEARTMAMLCHLLGIFTSFLGPLIIWLIKKDQSPFVDDQGKESLNWQITMMICMAGLFIPILNILIVLAIGVLRIVFGIIATMKSNQGLKYRYPFAIRLIK